MQQETNNSYERQLEGPAAYDRFNRISQVCQQRYLRQIIFQSTFLILVALLGAFSFEPGDLEWWVRHGIVGLSIGVLGILIYQQNRNYMKGWQNARFIAESVLSNAWLFAFKIGTYNGTEKEAIKAFLEDLDKIEKEVELKQFLDLNPAGPEAVAGWMKERFRDGDIQAKKAFYIEHRLDNQIDWYTRKSSHSGLQSNRWFISSLVLLIAGIVVTLIVPLYQFSALGFLSTLTATILTWRQTKRFDELKVTYAVAAKELQDLRARFELETDEPDILRFVEEAEKSISREHKLWFNWTYIS